MSIGIPFIKMSLFFIMGILIAIRWHPYIVKAARGPEVSSTCFGFDVIVGLSSHRTNLYAAEYILIMNQMTAEIVM